MAAPHTDERCSGHQTDERCSGLELAARAEVRGSHRDLWGQGGWVALVAAAGVPR